MHWGGGVRRPSVGPSCWPRTRPVADAELVRAAGGDQVPDFLHVGAGGAWKTSVSVAPSMVRQALVPYGRAEEIIVVVRQRRSRVCML